MFQNAIVPKLQISGMYYKNSTIDLKHVSGNGYQVMSELKFVIGLKIFQESGQ